MSVTSIDMVWRVGKTAVEIRCPQGFTTSTNNLAGKYHQTLTSLRLPRVAATVFLRRDTDSSRSWMEAATISGDIFLDVYSSPHQSSRGLAQDRFIRSQDAITKRTLWIPREVVRGDSTPELDALGLARFPDVERTHHINGLHLPQMQSCLAASYNLVTTHLASDAHTGTRAPTSRPFSQSSISEGDGVSESDRDAQLAYVHIHYYPAV